jgi:hypothetical protein
MQLPDYWLPRPSFSIDGNTGLQLEHLYLNLGQEEWIQEALEIPKWQFLCWLADEKKLLLHGSGNADIQVFEPCQSNDVDEFGNRKAVYAASDGIWPMFFAIVDRATYPMTIVNAAIRLESAKGDISNPYYFFSMSDKVLQQQPFRDGVVYVLPQEGFEEQAPYRWGDYLVHQNHWANRSPVKPLAKLQVTPEDFPFLEQIRGQDDDLLAKRFQENPNGFPWVE